jgi:uncharacterized protein (TIGR02598 family)
MAKSEKGFSLVETVVALGIFAFCILALLGLLLTGMRAARSVSDETNAVNIAASIYGALATQRNKQQNVTIGTTDASLYASAMVENLPAVNQDVSRREMFFDQQGRRVLSENEASLKMFYSVRPAASGSSSLVELEFWWPPQAPPNAAQRRVFSRTVLL